MLFDLFCVLFAVAISPFVFCHSWVERLMRIELNGTMIGDPGYIRGTMSRLDPAFTDTVMQSLLTDFDEPICKATQATRRYSVEFPALKAHAGDFVALQYQENGHVTMLRNSPHKAGSGEVFVYGTSMPHGNDHLASVYGVWNREGTGGSARGRLLGTWSFDDGQCYQINEGYLSRERQRLFPKTALYPSGADLWCQIDVRLPLDISNWYTLYWIWVWPNLGPSVSEEIYTSCMDIKVLPGTQEGSLGFVQGQDLNFAAIEEQMDY